MRTKKSAFVLMAGALTVLGTLLTGLPYGKLSWYPVVEEAKGLQYGEPADSDGDGLVDNVDFCPWESGPPDNGGCPWGDADGDGFTDNVDACPNLPAPGTTNGCPPPLVDLPADGPCVLSTGSSTENVRVREEPSLDSEVMGVLPANQIINVMGIDEAGEWYYLGADHGWIAGWVTRRGGICNDLPIVDPDNPEAAFEVETREESAPDGAGGIVREYGLLTSDPSISSIRAVFQVASLAGTSSDIYTLVDGVVSPLTYNTPENEIFPRLHPSGEMVVYLTEDATGRVSLKSHPITGVPSTFPMVAGMTIAPWPPAWFPSVDEQKLLITLLDNTGRSGVYLVDLYYPSATPRLILQDASSPVYDSSGTLIAFTRTDGTRRDILIADSQWKQERSITESLPGDVKCLSPAFVPDRTALLFVCKEDEQSQVFVYDGIGGLHEITLDVEDPGHPAPIPDTEFFSVDDGEMAYYMRIDEGEVQPLLKLQDKRISDLSWIPQS
jgi:Tol biopolymer transport system component